MDRLRLMAAACLALPVFLFCGCEMLQQLNPSPAPPPTAAVYDKAPADTALASAAASTPAPQPPSPPKKSAEFDAMMERLENRSPAPSITPRSESVAAAVASPKAAASTPSVAPTPVPAQPLIIRATPPPAPRPGASQLIATNPPPPKPVEMPAVAAVPRPRPVESLVVVGPHKPPPKSHAGLKTFLSVAIFALLGGSILLTFAPVRERLVDWKVAATVWWSTRKSRRQVANPGKKAKSAHNVSVSAWVNIVKSFAAEAVVWVKSLPIFRRDSPTAHPEAVVEPHRPTPAEMLLKKIGAPPSHDVSTSRAVKDLPHQPAETSVLPATEQQAVLASNAPTPASTPAATQPDHPPAASAAAATPESAAKLSPAVSGDTSTESRVNKVLQAPYAPVIITLMSPPPDPPAAAAPKPAEASLTSQKGEKSSAAQPTTPASENQPAVTPAPEQKPTPEEPKPAKKPEEPVAA